MYSLTILLKLQSIKWNTDWQILIINGIDYLELEND